MKHEIEAKFFNINKDAYRKKLLERGFVLETPEYMMKRRTFDIDAPSEIKKWGRVRQEADGTTMTIKEIRGTGIHDTYEVELNVDDFETACSFLIACNLRPSALQENFREVYIRDGVEVTIDTWPGLEPFTEIEADTEEAVKSVAEELGFDFSQSVYGSIDLVYEKLLGIPVKEFLALPEITFKNPPKKSTA